MADTHKNIRTKTIKISSFDGVEVDVFVAEPEGSGPCPAIVFGAEAFGVNTFIRETAKAVAALGYMAAVPDYYRGKGPPDPEEYEDHQPVFEALAELDFRAATYDLMASAEWLRGRGRVNAEEVAVWGYCTGGTMAMMAACLDRRLGAAVLFYPSQAVFPELTVKRPSHPMDLVWNIACPVLTIYGDEDYLFSPEKIAELRKRFQQWGINHEIIVYPEAKHAFSSFSPQLRNADAAQKAWAAATAFLARHLPARAG